MRNLPIKHKVENLTQIIFHSKKMIIYISGPITDDPFSEVKFEEAEQYFKSIGFKVVNPFKLDHSKNTTWEDYMKTDIQALVECHQIYMLNDWRSSKGATLEHLIATQLKLKIIYQTEE